MKVDLRQRRQLRAQAGGVWGIGGSHSAEDDTPEKRGGQIRKATTLSAALRPKGVLR